MRRLGVGRRRQGWQRGRVERQGGDHGSGASGPGGRAGFEGGTAGGAAAAGGRAGGAAGGLAMGTGGAGDGWGGAAGSSNPCGTSPSVCSAGARTCAGGVPQECVADLDGCTNWHAQPACSAAQVCGPTTGVCECRDDPACGDPALAGDFCPVEGAATHATCVKGVDGCYTVMTEIPCALDRACNTDAPTTIVSQGLVCGCPPPVGSSGNQGGSLDESVKLLGTGCTTAQAAASARIGSPGDDAVLTCLNTNSCPIWQVITSCGAQQLTGGIESADDIACLRLPEAGQGWAVLRRPEPDPQGSPDDGPAHGRTVSGGMSFSNADDGVGAAEPAGDRGRRPA